MTIANANTESPQDMSALNSRPVGFQGNSAHQETSLHQQSLEQASMETEVQGQERANDSSSLQGKKQDKDLTSKDKDSETEKNKHVSEQENKTNASDSSKKNGLRMKVYTYSLVVSAIFLVVLLQKTLTLIPEKGLSVFLDTSGGTLGCFALGMGFMGHGFLDKDDANNTAFGLDLTVGFISLIAAIAQLAAICLGL